MAAGAASRYGLGALAVVGILRVLVAGGLVPPAIMRPLGFVVVAAFPIAVVLSVLRPRRARVRSIPMGVAGQAILAVGAVLLATWIALATPRGAGETRGSAVSTPEPRVLVLPLIDLDGRGDRYFADGLTDELAAALVAVEGLEVRGRASAATRLDVNRDAADLAERFGAAAALDGTVRRSGGRLRVNVRLVDAVSGGVVWSTSRDTTLDGVFDVRDDIAEGVAGVLGLEMSERTVRRLERRRTTVEALDLYMLGRFRWASGPGGDLVEAAAYYHLAIEADSSFAPAWTALAETYATLPRFTRFPPDAARRDGAAAARTALRLEPDAASAHAALGEILYLYERDWSGARSHLERAVELDPGDGAAHDRWCEMSLYLGDLAAARAQCEAARRRDPLAFRPAWLAARIDRAAGDLEVGIARLDSLVQAFPDFEPLAADLAIVRLTRDGAVALPDLGRWLGLLGGPEAGDSLASVLIGGGVPSAVQADPDAVRSALTRVETRLQPDPAHLAGLLAALGLEERAEEVAVSALDARSPGSLGFGVLPEFASLRVRPVIQSRLETAGLVDARPSGGE